MRRMRIILGTFCCLLTLVVTGSPFAPLVSAAEYTSGTFRAIDPHINSFGGIGTSTSFFNIHSSGQMTDGPSTSTSFMLDAGPLYYGSYSPLSLSWRWYGDENNETPTDALAAENTAPTGIDESDVLKLRVTVDDTAGIGQSTTKFRLEFSTSSSFATGTAGLVAEVGDCTDSSLWCYADGAGNDNATITTSILSDADSCVASSGDGCGSHNESGTTTSSHAHVAGAIAEYEFVVVRSGAIQDTTYFFRLIDTVSSSTVYASSTATYPSLVPSGAELTFSIDAVASSTATEGVTTDVDTTPTSVPFGSLPIGSSAEAAHTLTVSTNAASGYKIFAYQRQGLLNTYGSAIDPVTGTNASPSAWGTGCTGGADGCYGYHTGEDVLEGGSTRFAADDTYAQFTGTPNEVGFSSGPIEDDSTDIVYRVEVDSDQESGTYSTNVVYIITAVF